MLRVLAVVKGLQLDLPEADFDWIAYGDLESISLGDVLDLELLDISSASGYASDIESQWLSKENGVQLRYL